jgi:hypothetical protein
MECNIKVKSYFCDVDHKSAVKNFCVFSIYFNHLVDDLFFAAFLIKSASLQNDKWGSHNHGKKRTILSLKSRKEDNS